ncbi:hypothetical protein MW290_22910 [Aquincola tertiaricarbonis]|uniref:Uncharacterized protein n=1 Tax=Aquincola tertiaricarbonis TaxID=391953 RepID=A0ABY4SEL3_AQUTE|nr:hypothetical protein [Aquincola tertiaricarbonis]URI11767.1 hypothetical protein MW290_22910 [Aquincola tertiaricarbonis]
MSAVHPTVRRPAARPHPGMHTRAHARRLSQAIVPAAFPAPEDDELIGAVPWLTVYADEDEDGSADELLMETPAPRQQQESAA